MLDCKKCGAQDGTVLLRKMDYYCTDCFITNINHKFRACIGKNKILSRNERVLICLTGGLASTVLLDLIHVGLSTNNFKKLQITPVFFHIIELGATETAQSVIKQCSSYNYDLHLCHISEYTNADKSFPMVNDIEQLNDNANNDLKSLLHSLKTSSRNDYLNTIKRDLFIKYAQKLDCKYIFTAEMASTLAVNLIANITLGRGSQIQHTAGFGDSRNIINILRPMKDISIEELQNYIKFNNLNLLEPQSRQENSIQSVIQSFVVDLQENYSSTISTVCKTADKIGAQVTKNNLCSVCESAIGGVECKLTALEATNYSRFASSTLNGDMKNSKFDEENHSSAIFPFVNVTLCYACSRNYSESKPESRSKLIPH